MRISKDINIKRIPKMNPQYHSANIAPIKDIVEVKKKREEIIENNSLIKKLLITITK